MAQQSEIIKERGYQKSALTRLVNYSENITPNATIFDVQSRLERLELVFKDLLNLDSKLSSELSEIEDIENKYFDTKSRLLAFIESINQPLPPQNLSTSGQIPEHTVPHQLNSSDFRMPRLNIPNFNGDIIEWLSFKDLYISLVHNNANLQNIQKFQYLRGLLGEVPAAVIRHIPVSETTYEEAWSRLLARFDKKKCIVSSLISTFLNQPRMPDLNETKLRCCVDTSEQIFRSLKTIVPNESLTDVWLIHLLLEKLDVEIRRVWAEKTVEEEFPSFQSFLAFLNERCFALESMNSELGKPNTPSRETDAKPVRVNYKCPKCHQPHFLNKCSAFLSLSVVARKEFVRKRNLCFNCLSDKHTVRQCSSTYTCRQCKGSHHTSLHEGIRNNLGTLSSTNNDRTIPPTNSANTSVSVNAVLTDTALLPTAKVTATDKDGKNTELRILLDSGSQATFITEKAVRRLKMKVNIRKKTQVSGIACSNSVNTSGTVVVEIKSQCDETHHFKVEAHVMNTLTAPQPSQALSIKDSELLIGLKLADNSYSTPGDIDMILGVDHFFKLILPGQVLNDTGTLIAQNSRLGWIVVGEAAVTSTSELSANFLDVNKQLKKFWEVESVFSPSAQDMTEEEKFCEDHFRENLETSDDGRFVVKLPIYKPSSALGESYRSAKLRLFSMERKLASSSVLKTEYDKFMQDYENLGHMEGSDDSSDLIPHRDKFYLPHHAVLKESSSTTKLRVVFDGSCPSKTNVSLNDILGVGPKVQRDLFEILLAFRMHKVAYSADIAKMYRQILVQSDDQTYQRILWRYSPSNPVSEFKLKTVTYGLSCSSFLATRCLKQIADDCIDYPQASKVILDDFYMDDLLSGSNTPEEALEVCTRIDSLLRARGFELRKWRCNSPALIHNLKVEITNHDVEIESSENCKVLGLLWNSGLDKFQFKPNIKIDGPLTKRKILSQSAQVFDSLGLISPIIVYIKIFYQKLWLLKCDWDDPLPTDLAQDWFKFQEQFNNMDVKVPRCVVPNSGQLSLIGFCDASTHAYAAVVYIRQQSTEGTSISLLVSKTKVAPLKQLSIPKLELCSALLLTRLLKAVKKILSLEEVPVHSWTDSKVVLAWLSAIPRKWKCFVANRTSEILDTLPRCNWNYVKSAENPADLASRGTEPKSLMQNQLWWHGPKFLSDDASVWPQEPINDEKEIPEDRSDTIYSHVVQLNDTLESLFEKHSSLSKLIRIIAYCLRFISKPRSSSTLQISIPEIRRVKMILYKWVQACHFRLELDSIRDGKPLKRSSDILSLNPFMDKNGLLRAGGRLKHSNLGYDSKHPILLPGKHRISVLIIREAHIFNKHAAPTFLSNILKQSFWITGSKKLIRQVIRNCLVCLRYKAPASSQLMGDLPSPRVKCSRPFSNCGVDFAGPIQVKIRKGRSNQSTKGYISLFICLAVKAVHLELVSDLTSQSFIAALKRFSSRRGAPLNIFCDNATNFVGARNKLKDLSKFIRKVNDDPDIAYYLTQQVINWHMIPASSPHMGGIWEANVKSMKYHLKRVIGNSLLTFEELSTLLCEIEFILNSRPLVAQSDGDVDSIDALTPSHFLIGEKASSVPDDVGLSTRWNLLSSMVQGFWKRWQLEYLNSLQQRTKWRVPQPNLKIGDIVILRESHLPPATWPLGKVMEVFPGADGLVRVVRVKTSKGIFSRTIAKLVKLPEDCPSSDQSE